MRTAVVILNWNTKGYLRVFLPALLHSVDGEKDRVVVADNASADGSLEMLAAEFPQVQTVALDSNYGFTGGYNRALAQLEADYYVLINSDILVEDGWLEPLVAWMETHPRCAACGPKLHGLIAGEKAGSSSQASGEAAFSEALPKFSAGEKAGFPGGSALYRKTDLFEYAGAAGGFLDRWGFPFCRGRVMNRVCEDRGQYDTPADVQWCSGACLMVRSSVWKELGGLDDRFFAHMEEIDFCWRARSAGWSVTVVPQSVVWHLGGGTLTPKSPWKLELNYRNNLLLLDNNLAGRKAERKIRGRIAIDNLTRIAYFLQGKKDYAAAVRKAHAGFRELRHKPRPGIASTEALPEFSAGVEAIPAPEAGLSPIDIIPNALLRGGGIFKFLDKKIFGI